MKILLAITVAIIFPIQVHSDEQEALESYKNKCGTDHELKPGDKIELNSYLFNQNTNYGPDSACHWTFSGSSDCPSIEILCPIIDLRPHKGNDYLDVGNKEGHKLVACGKNKFASIPYKSKGDLIVTFVQEDPDFKHFARIYKGFQCFVYCSEDGGANARPLPDDNGYRPSKPWPLPKEDGSNAGGGPSGGTNGRGDENGGNGDGNGDANNDNSTAGPIEGESGPGDENGDQGGGLQGGNENERNGR